MKHARTILLLFMAALVCGASIYLPHRRAAFRSGSSTLNESLTAYWALDESSGTRADSQGSNDLTDSNTVGSASQKFDSVAWFVRANNEFLSLADNSDVSIGDADFSIAGWFNLTNATSFSAIIGKYDTAGNRDYQVRIWQSGIFYLDISTDGTAVTTLQTNFVSTSTWYFFAVGYDSTANEMFISINAQDKLKASCSAGPYDSTQDFNIGARVSGDRHWDGYLARIGLWKKVLSDEEIDELYNSGNGITCCPF